MIAAAYASHDPMMVYRHTCKDHLVEQRDVANRIRHNARNIKISKRLNLHRHGDSADGKVSAFSMS